jgi:hypothetical protein
MFEVRRVGKQQYRGWYMITDCCCFAYSMQSKCNERQREREATQIDGTSTANFASPQNPGLSPPATPLPCSSYRTVDGRGRLSVPILSGTTLTACVHAVPIFPAILILLMVNWPDD